MPSKENQPFVLSPAQANLPPDVDVNELNQYLAEKDARLFRRPVWPFVVLALIIGVLLACVLRGSLKALPLVLCGLGAALMTFFLVIVAISANDRRCGIYNSCPNCMHPLRTALDQPQGLWSCTNCGFEHFKNWRSRNSGRLKNPGPRIVTFGGGAADPAVCKRCPRCGKTLPKTAIKCMHCGENLVSEDGTLYMG
jgi:hypothetical protein